MNSKKLKVIALCIFFILILVFSISFLKGVFFPYFPTEPEVVGVDISPREGLSNPANLIYVDREKLDKKYNFHIQFYTTPKFGLIEESRFDFVGFNPKEYLKKYPGDVALVQYEGDIDNRLLYIVDIFTDNITRDIPGY